MIGLKRGLVELEDYDENWPLFAEKIMHDLKTILKEDAIEVAHVGSTAIVGIKAKPIIDIMVAVEDLSIMDQYVSKLESKGIIDRGSDVSGQRLFVMGDFKKDTRDAHIHVVMNQSAEHLNYLKFKKYLNEDENLKKEYENLKEALALKYPSDRQMYTHLKADFIQKVLDMK